MGGEGLRGKKQSQRDKFEGAWGGALLEPRSKGDLGGEGQRNQQKREKNAYTQVMLANWEILREKGLGKV